MVKTKTETYYCGPGGQELPRTRSTRRRSVSTGDADAGPQARGPDTNSAEFEA